MWVSHSPHPMKNFGCAPELSGDASDILEVSVMVSYVDILSVWTTGYFFHFICKKINLEVNRMPLSNPWPNWALRCMILPHFQPVSSNGHVRIRDYFNWKVGKRQRGDLLRVGRSGDRIPVGRDRSRSPPSLLYNGYRFLPGVKEAGAWCWPPPPSAGFE